MTNPGGPTAPFFTVSLDFELFWGMFDVVSSQEYGSNILGVRQAIPSMLQLFRERGIHATWATVGMVMCENKRDLLAHLPDIRPEYVDRRRDPYTHLSEIGENESSDPWHFGHSLVQQILETPGMELGSHTFSHLCCLEPRKNRDAFRSDLHSAVAVHARLGVTPTSLVFPRNQYDGFHLGEAAAAGFTVYRGNEAHPWYQPQSAARPPLSTRAARLLDAYVNVTGDQTSFVHKDGHGLVDVPSSRFLRPSSTTLAMIEPLRRRRILSSLRRAAATGGGFHLWWHPHNFGVNLRANMAFLRSICDEFQLLRDEFGMRSLTMAEAAAGASGAT